MQQQSFDPWIKFSLVIALVAAAAWNPSLVSHRLPPSGQGIPPAGIQDIPARLWQDPFTEMLKYKEQACGGGANSDCPVDGLDWLNRQIQLRASTNNVKSVDVIYALVSGANRVGAPEARRRTRYAVLAGLAADGYSPRDPEHIGYVEQTIKLENNPETLIDIPFEWMGSDGTGKPPVLVLWINEDVLEQEPRSLPVAGRESCDEVRPLARLHYIIDQLTSPGKRGITAHPVIIGPSSSTFFADAASELSENQGSNCKSDPEALAKAYGGKDGLFWYSPSATTPDDFFKIRDSNGKETGQTVKDRVGYKRVIDDDQEQEASLIGELDRRLLHSDGNRKNESLGEIMMHKGGRVLLVGQWDTTYSRRLVCYFRQQLASSGTGGRLDKHYCASDRKEPIIVKNYLRGIDGLTADSSKNNADQKSASNDSSNIIDKVLSQSDRPEGEPQVDYLRRLGNEVTERARSEHFRVMAVGIFGDDYHDKLMALEELRSVFPQSVFFTTDLDSAMLYHVDNKVTRNLIVASNYGLYLRPEIQKDIPPFRDSYQTATFLAVRLAIYDIVHNEGENRHGVMPVGWLKPHIFEIGRSMPVPLDALNDEDNYRPCDPFIDCQSPNPVFANNRKSILMICIIIVFAAVAVSYYRASTGDISGARASLWWILMIIPFLVIFMILYGMQGKGGEPFGWWSQGISIWPSEFIRLLAIFVGLALLARGRSKVLKYDKETAEIFGMTEPEGIKLRDVLRKPWGRCYWGKGEELAGSEIKSVAELWQCYLGNKWHSSQWSTERRGIGARLVIKVLTIVAIVGAIFFVGVLAGADAPASPARGTFAFAVDAVMISVVVLVFIVLSSYTIDRLVRAIWMVNAMRRYGVSMLFPSKAIQDIYYASSTEPDPVSGDSTHYHYWLSCYFIGKVTEPVQRLIFYSYSVWILFIFSRSHLIDGWHTPFILYIVFLAYAALLGIPALVLRYSAEKFRSDAVNWFNERLIVMSGAKDTERSRQAETIRNQISDLKIGAFAPFSQQPLVEAAMALISSVSGLLLLEQYIP